MFAGSLALGCSSDRFQCSEDTSCVVEGIAGFCESNGYCSFPDEECDSGRRYGQMAPAEFAGVCVGVGPGESTGSSGIALTSLSGGSTSSGSTSGESSSTASDESTTTTTISTTSGAETSSSTGTPQPQPNVVFVSSVAIDLQLGQVDVAQVDALCNELAAGELPGEFVAWLPDGDLTASQRLGSARGWVRPDGRPFTDRVADLVEGRIFYPPVLDETGGEVRTQRVLTGTAVDGDVDFDCMGWQAGAGLMTVGSPGAMVPSWTDDAGLPCDPKGAMQSLRVYCFGVDADVEVSFDAESGRQAFVTTNPIAASVGRADMDTRCSEDADLAGLEGTFLAVVALSNSAALSRFDLELEPWVNTRGVPLSETAASLGQASHLDVSAWLTASGDVPIAGGMSSFWTGALGVSAEGTTNCADWTSDDPDDNGFRFTVDQSSGWFQGPAAGCDESHHVLCFET